MKLSSNTYQISGGTGSGKTSIIDALNSSIPDNERIVVIEDASELQSRPSKVEGKGTTNLPILPTFHELVRESLRMTPNRIIIGEIRGEEIVDLLTAMNTGHDGSYATWHGNTPRDMVNRRI